MSARPAAVTSVAYPRCVVVRDLRRGECALLARGGATAVLLLARRADRRELVQLLTEGFRGGVTSGPGQAGLAIGLERRASASLAPQRGTPLTERELGVLSLVADGCTNRVIGVALGVSTHTVKSHLARISRKLGPGDRAALVGAVIRRGLIA